MNKLPPVFSFGFFLSLAGVVFTVILKIAEGLVSQQISIIGVSTIPDIDEFFVDEYFHIGLDLLVVSFSFITGAAIGQWNNATADKRDLLVPVLFMAIALVATLIAKGLSDQAVSNYQSRILNQVAQERAQEDGRGGSSISYTIVEKYLEIDKKCNPEVESSSSEETMRSACHGYRTSKNWQIFCPTILALLSLGLAVWGVSRLDTNRPKDHPKPENGGGQ